jgi:hypothetical protein
MSPGMMASAQGLFEGSIADMGYGVRPCLLSLLLSRMDFSPLTARDLARLEELDPDTESGPGLEVVLEVSK